MKRFSFIIVFALSCLCLLQAQDYVPSDANLKARQEFKDSKLGVFFHWGLYSMYAHGEWSMQVENLNAA